MRLLALALLLAAGCALPQEPAALTGTWVMHRGDIAADTITLRADGRYVRRYLHPGEPAAVDSGAWFLSKNRKLVALRDFPKRWRFVHDCMYSLACKVLTEPTMLALTIERSRLGFGDVHLTWHSEYGWWYERPTDSSR